MFIVREGLSIGRQGPKTLIPNIVVATEMAQTRVETGFGVEAILQDAGFNAGFVVERGELFVGVGIGNAQSTDLAGVDKAFHGAPYFHGIFHGTEG